METELSPGGARHRGVDTWQALAALIVVAVAVAGCSGASPSGDGAVVASAPSATNALAPPGTKGSTPGSATTARPPEGTTPGTRPRWKLVEVYVAKATIAGGTPAATSIAQRSVELSTIPQQFRPATAINTTDEIELKVALFDISPGTIIVQGMFVDPAVPGSGYVMPVVPPATVSATPPATTADGDVEVFIAAGNALDRGTSAADAAGAGDLVARALPAEYRPETAITSLDQIAGKVALFDLAPGTIIVDGMFVAPDLVR